MARQRRVKTAARGSASRGRRQTRDDSTRLSAGIAWLILAGGLLASCSQIETTIIRDFGPEDFGGRLSLMVQDANDRKGRRHPAQLAAMKTEFEIALMGKGYSFVPRRDEMSRYIEEMEIQSSSLTKDQAHQMGNLANAPALLLVELNEYTTGRAAEPQELDEGRRLGFETQAKIIARLYDLESGKLLWQSNGPTQRLHEWNRPDIAVVEWLAQQMAAEFPPTPPWYAFWAWF